MKHKELRLALVCYGGVSLAVYMHGATREFLKLARASRAYHAEPDVAARAGFSYADQGDDRDGAISTEAVYFDLLKAIGDRLDLRVIIDVVAGASAGGINGVVLARALAHDLPLEPLRDWWLREADVTQLIARKGQARAWSKWFLRPAIWVLTRRRLALVAPDPDMRRKLSAFLRSRWFRPPFDGARLAGVLFDAIEEMGGGTDESGSLLPDGLSLDLFVSVTDFYGYGRVLRGHDPPLIKDREHRHVLRFGYRRPRGGGAVSTLERGHAASLAFAARATSSYPGAFPPAQIGEMDAILAARGRDWPTRSEFLEGNFARYRRAGTDPLATCFVDGSVLNNKPFAEAIDAIRGKPAYRDVDRRLVFIDPDPKTPPPPADGRVPGYFRTLKAALSDIPRNEPISDELTWIDGFNERVQRLRAIVDAARPQVEALVAEVVKGRLNKRPSVKRIRNWRAVANMRAARETGFAYEGYLRLKIGATIQDLGNAIAGLCGHEAGSTEARWIVTVLHAWARRAGVEPESGALSRRDPRQPMSKQPAWARFLYVFDRDYRQRRLAFVIRTLNLLYGRLDEAPFAGDSTDRLDQLKTRLYQARQRIHAAADFPHLRPEGRDGARRLFAGPVPEAWLGQLPDAAMRFAIREETSITELVAHMGRGIDATALNEQADAVFATIGPWDLGLAAWRELLTAYVGFAFWDVLTFTIAHWRDLGEFDAIRVDRVSPEDAQSIRAGGTAATLKGIEFNHFGAFFSRGHRENDYLWGRLHAAERLIDIVCDAARLEGAAGAIEPRRLKKRAFAAILDSEAVHLRVSAALVETLRREVNALWAEPDDGG